MREQDYAVNNSVQAEQLEVSRVLRNTYGLRRITQLITACRLSS